MNKAETQSRFPTGEWSGYFMEGRPERGWMHLYLSFDDGRITGEGTDYVGPWHIRGTYDELSGVCNWVKQYLGRHQVIYTGLNEGDGIVGQWTIGNYLDGTFHVWPKGHGGLDEMYLQEQLGDSRAF